MKPSPLLFASLGIALAGVLWGLIWYPIRLLEGYGVGGAWPGIVIYGGCSLILLPVALARLETFRRYWKPLLLSGLFTGTAFAAYSTSLLFTEVVRALLLFYLTPIWGTALGILMLGERLTWQRGLALILGFGGLLIVFGIDEGFPLPRNLGDWLALASGVAWAYGSVKLYKMGNVATFEQIFAFVFGAFIVTGLGLLLAGDQLGALPPLPAFKESGWVIILTVLYILPMLFLTVWPTSILSPGRVGLLLMGDVLVGVISAALFAGEPFGWRELSGTILIVSAGFIEVLGRREAESQTPQN